MVLFLLSTTKLGSLEFSMKLNDRFYIFPEVPSVCQGVPGLQGRESEESQKSRENQAAPKP